jgi:hypothetical protein
MGCYRRTPKEHHMRNLDHLNRDQLDEVIFVLASLYPEQNAARGFWERAGGEGAWFYHAPRGMEMWTHNIRGILDGRTGHPRPIQLFRQALKENPEEAAPLQKYLEQQ